ncbi:MAG: F0F1 ATP synthase subunit A [Gemmiger sp.]|nr:F0F1 ATP synthase subunit A [Gemmiger sp.]
MDIEINGARILFSFSDVPLFGTIHITQTLLMSWIVMALVTGACIWLGHGLTVEGGTRRQALAELAVTKLMDFVHGNMGKNFDKYIPLVGAIFVTSIVSNLMGLFGMWSPTADLSTELAWALVVFVLITYYKLKSGGLKGYLRSFLDPIFLFAPLNVISEFATPVSMACRHFGNILSGTVIGGLIYAALAAASYALFGAVGSSLIVSGVLVVAGAALLLRARAANAPKWQKIVGILCLVVGGLALLTRLPVVGAFAASFPFLDVGLPAVTSLYFDWFSGCIQAFIFCTLTTIFIKQAAGEE